MRRSGYWLACRPLDQSGPLPIICLRISWAEATLDATTTPGDEGLDPATIRGVVRQLMAPGLVRRSRDPMDSGTAVLESTEAGVVLIRSVVASARGAHEAALAPLAPEEQTQLLGLLRTMG